DGAGRRRFGRGGLSALRIRRAGSPSGSGSAQGVDARLHRLSTAQPDRGQVPLVPLALEVVEALPVPIQFFGAEDVLVGSARGEGSVDEESLNHRERSVSREGDRTC